MMMKPNLSSASSRSWSASVWNLLSQRYSEVLIGLNGSKSIVTFLSLFSSVSTVPQYRTRPLGGTLLKSFRRCCVEVIASSTDSRLTRDLMFEAVPYSSASILAANEICDFGGRISEIMLVPLLRAERPMQELSVGPLGTLSRQ